MSKELVVILTEKPSASRNWAKALGGMSGTYKGTKYTIVNNVGHLFQLPAEPDKLTGGEYEKWNLDDIPWDHTKFKWKKRRRSNAKDIYDKIKNAASSATEVCHAGDHDPSGEGSLIGWETINSLNFKGKVTRAYFYDETEDSLRKAFENRKEVKLDSDGDYVKAEARTRFDYLSMQYPRILTLAAGKGGYHPVLKAGGRLKSYITTEIGKQLDLVNNYKEEPYYTVRFKDENNHVYKRTVAKEDRHKNKEDVSLKEWENSEVIVDSVKQKRQAPGKLLDLANLSAILVTKGYKPADVENTYQNMYQDSIVSYPRTSDKVVTNEQFNELLPLVNSIAKLVDVDIKILTYRKPRKTHVKDEGVSHGANRPGVKVPKSLAEVERKYGVLGKEIYIIVAKNYLSMLADDYVYDQQKGHLKKYPDFTGTANIPVSYGYKLVFDSDKESKDEEEQDNNALPLGKLAKAYVHRGVNPKPQNPTRKWLVNKMDKANIGTGATRSSTITEMAKSNKTQIVIEKKGKLSLTESGLKSYELLKDTYISNEEITKKLQDAMDNIGNFKTDPKKLYQLSELIVKHDKQKILENSSKVEGYKPSQNKKKYPTKEKASGTYTGEDKNKGESVSFNKEWSGHTFTDEEVELLLKGEEIEIEAISKKGKPYKVSGTLAKQKYKGNEFWGFKPDFS